MSMFRSDPMGLYNIVMPRDHGWEIFNQLGELSALQFVDLNATEAVFNRPYSNYVKRCEDIESKITVIETQLSKFNKPIERCQDPRAFLLGLRQFLDSRQRTPQTYFEEAEQQLEERLASLNEQTKIYDNLIERYNGLVEYKQVLIKTRPILFEEGGYSY